MLIRIRVIKDIRIRMEETDPDTRDKNSLKPLN